MAFFDVDDEIGRGRMFHRGFLPSLAQTAVGCAEFRSELPGDVRKRRSDIDQGANRLCWGCNQCICKHDDKTAFPIELTYDENDRWLDVRGGACCEQCSQLADYDLWEKITS